MKIKKAASFFWVFALAAVVIFAMAGCKNPDSVDPARYAVIDMAAIQGLAIPATTETPVKTITANAQYSGTVTWSPNHSTFAASTVYTATITLTAKENYTLQGVAANFFTVSGAILTSNNANSGSITAVFPQTGGTADNPTIISIADIDGLAPATGGTPAAITENVQYSGTVTWSPAVSGTFDSSTIYTATITLTAKAGFTLQGVAANFFTVAGALLTSNNANSGIITAVFPQTAVTGITSVNISITAPVKGATPSTTASAGGGGNFTVSPVSWSPNDNPFLGGIVYTATVTMTANSGYTFAGLSSSTVNGQSAAVSNNTGSAVTLSRTFPATNTKTVTNIAIKTQPTNLNYTHGGTLDLAGLVVTLTHDDTTTEDVVAANFADKNITATPAAGNNLIYSAHNGQPVNITYGDLICNTNNLTVNPKAITFTVDAIPAQTYTGSEIRPAITVKDGSTTLTPTADYTTAYTNNVNTGTATVTITGAGNYAGSSGSVNFTINPVSITNAQITVAAPVKGATPGTSAVGGDNFTIGAVSWSPNNNPFLGGAVYTATVTLTANSGYTFAGLSSASVNGQSAAVSSNTGSAVTLSHTFPATNTKTVTNIAIKTQPTNLNYTHGDTLNLAGLVVTLTHDDTTAEDVVAANFSEKNITANPAAGNNLVYSAHNGQPVKITYGSLTCNTGNLTVNRATFTAAPTLTLTAGIGTLSFAWTASNPVADSYDIYLKAGNSLSAANVKTGAKITGATSGGSISGLANGTAYSVVVTANKQGYNSVDSAVRTGTPAIINATQPVISAQPQGGTFFKTGTLSVTASVTDGGTLSYQWYRNTDYNTTGGTAIIGATGSSYTLSDVGAYYYYVVVTNTIANNGDGGTKTAQTISSVVKVTVELVLAEWARTVSIISTGDTTFSAVAVDSSGNVYAAGYQYGDDTYTYGTGVSAQGTASGGSDNVVLVKYNSSGTALWARTVSAGSSASRFSSVAVDSVGNVYAAGYQYNDGTYTYGTGVSAQGSNYGYFGKNAVLVKYDSSGTAQWARTVSVGSYPSEFVQDSPSEFFAVAVDSAGNVYAAGYQSGTGTYTYGAGISAQGTYSGLSDGWWGLGPNNVVLVKYNSSGAALWARTVSAGSDRSCFNTVAVDSTDNVYAAGYQDGTGTYTYGAGVSVQGINGQNVVLVKYNSSGVAQWARTVNSGDRGSVFNAVAVDSTGNVYAAGCQYDTGTYTYGTGVSAQGTNFYENVVLVKYNSSGVAQWARTVSSGDSRSSEFNAVAVDSTGNVYASGYQTYTGTYTYGTGVSAQGTSSVNNVVLVKYNSNGAALWARTVSTGSNVSIFNSVAVDSSGNVYAAGYQIGTGTYTYGAGVSAQGSISYSGNVVLVKYKQ